VNPLTDWPSLLSGEYNWRLQWSPEHPALVFTALAVLVPLTLWFFKSGLARVPSRAKRILLLAVRSAALALLALVTLHPQLEFRKSGVLKNSIAVLLDNSLSLSIRAETAGKRRIDWVREEMEKRRAFFAELRKTYDVDFYYFSDGLEPALEGEVAKGYRAVGSRTDFTQALHKVKELYAGRSLQGLVLYSDGADLAQSTPEIDPELGAVAIGLKIPIHTFQAGTDAGFKDVGIEAVDAPDFGFVQQPFHIKAIVTAVSMGRVNASLVLREGDKILASKTLSLSPDKNRYEADFEIAPTQLGKRIYTLTIPLFERESIVENNRLDFQVSVARDRVRVLHLNGRPSWDSRFLREALAQNPKIDLLSFFILRSLADDVGATTGELSLIPFPSNLLFSDYLSSFDLIIFHNFQFSPFIDKKNLVNIRKYVEEGGAFLMVGGDLSFQAGGYKNTAVEEVLPVRFQTVNAEVLADEFHLTPARKMSRHPLLRLEKDAAMNRAAWQSLPPLNGINAGLAPADRARVAASYVKGQMEYPVLVLGHLGKGRSMAIATDSLWNWNFRKVGEGGSGRYYQKFWNNAIAWLTRDPETHNLQVETDKDKYGVDEKPTVRYRVYDEDFSPVAEGSATLIVTASAAQREVLRQTVKTDADGEGSFQINPPGEGFYTVRVEATVQGETATSETTFQVFVDTAEFQNPMVNAGLLRELARLTGGTYQILDGNTKMESLRFPNPQVRVDSRLRTLSLWDNWWFFGCILGLLAVDWWVRRKSGLS
jgi:uncharacterized membrane protein